MGDEDVNGFIFELSSSSRTSILEALLDESLSLQQISRKLGMTVTEAFRHLQRLNKTCLVQKQLDGAYRITPLGKLSLGLLSHFDFLSTNAAYFVEHNANVLPYEFVNRFGELCNSTLETKFIGSLNHATRMYKEAENFIWTITDQIQLGDVPLVVSRLREGLTFRLLFKEDQMPLVKPVAGVEDKIERKHSPLIDCILLLTDKEGFIGLPSVEGKMDFTGFFSCDPTFRMLIRDIYSYYWDRAYKWYYSANMT